MRSLDPTVEVVEFTPTPEQYAWTFGGAAPVARVRPGTAVAVVERRRVLRPPAVGDRPAEHRPADAVRQPADRSVLRRGRRTRDTLVLHVVDLEPARDWGASALIPFFGGLTSTDRTATLQPPLPERTWIYHLDSARGTVGLDLGDVHLDLPWNPCSGQSASRRPRGRSAQPSCPTCSAGTWTPRNCAPGRRSTCASTSRARCSPWGTGTSVRARGSPAVPPSRVP